MRCLDSIFDRFRFELLISFDYATAENIRLGNDYFAPGITRNLRFFDVFDSGDGGEIHIIAQKADFRIIGKCPVASYEPVIDGVKFLPQSIYFRRVVVLRLQQSIQRVF